MGLRVSVIMVFLYVVLGHAAKAQYNDSTHYHIALLPTGSVNRTNTGTAYLLNNALRFNVKRKDISLNFTNTWIYGRQNTNLTNNDYSGFLDFNLYKTIPHFYYWGLLNYNTSYSLKINNQLLAGAGIAYSIIDTKTSYLNISNGVLYDQSDLQLPGDVRDVYHTYRNSARLTFMFNINDLVVINSSSFLQNSFDRRYDYIIRSTNSLSLKMNKWLSLTTSLNYNRVNRTSSENLLFVYGLTLEKYF